MKRTFARFIAGVALLAGMFLFAGRAEAQSLQSGAAASTTNWKPAGEVQQICVDQVEFWHTKVDQYAPGTSNYLNVFRHITFYKSVFDSIETGESVATAVAFGLGRIDPKVVDSSPAATKTVIGAMQEEALELLAQ